jgi:16S rRNA (guanine966-N2)-methyltransferase
MRVIAGNLGGRTFDSPRGHRTHPMSEKIRGAIFNALGDIEGLTVLDVFAGSGALSIEAISRGAAFAEALDADKLAYAVIKKNISSLELEGKIHTTLIYADSWSTRHQKDKYDLVFLDPPYDKVEAETAEKLALHTKVGGVSVFSLPPHARIVLPAKKFKLINSKKYGDATLTFYRRISL